MESISLWGSGWSASVARGTREKNEWRKRLVTRFHFHGFCCEIERLKRQLTETRQRNSPGMPTKD